MCFGGRAKDDTGAARSRELDRNIRQDEKRMAKEVKLLLLGKISERVGEQAAAGRWMSQWLTASFTGAGESGKSTVLKQMKLIYTQGFSKNEKMEWKPVVFNNVVHSFRTIFEAMKELHVPFQNPENEVSAARKKRPFPPPSMPP